MTFIKFALLVFASLVNSAKVTLQTLNDAKKVINTGTTTANPGEQYLVEVPLGGGVEWVKLTTAGYGSTCKWFYTYPNATKPVSLTKGELNVCKYPVRTTSKRSEILEMPVWGIAGFDWPDTVLILKCTMGTIASSKIDHGCSTPDWDGNPVSPKTFKFGREWWLAS